ncbi:MAG: glycoside hydrolase family 3 protein, partial [Promethearchaeota archaeon]
MSRDKIKDFPFRDETLDLEKRLDDLLSRLTNEDKFRLFSGKNFWITNPIKRLGIPSFGMTDGPHGVAPHSTGFKKSTYFPTGITLGSTWNPELLAMFGKCLAEETRASGRHMILGPAINIQRTPLCGRTFEYLTEDPYLNKELATSIVKAIQAQRIAACAKHFVANNQEKRRMSVSSEVSMRALHEIYFPAFKAVVEDADVWSVMACYNKVNGVFGCENHWLLTEILREKWGFRGFVVSDWFATKGAAGPETCINAGLNLEMPGHWIFLNKKYRKSKLRGAFKKGKFTQEILDQSVRCILRVMFLVGCFDNVDHIPPGSKNTKEHQQVARKIAEEGMVLLKNEG